MSSTTVNRLVTLLIGIPVLHACQTGTAERGRVDRAIINGTVDEDPAHDAVVALTDADGNPFCTGTYVGNQTVVTAAHCFDDAASPEFVYFGVDEVLDNEACLEGDDIACSQFLLVEESLIHPDYSAAEFDAGNDIALLAIGEDPLDIEPISFLAFSAETEFTMDDVGTPVAFVGFGVTDAETQSGSGLRRIADGTLDALGPAAVDVGGEEIPLGEDQVLSGQGDAGTCQGDSGGPLLIERGGREFLGAVTSFGDDLCLGYGVSVTVDVHENFIREFYGDGDVPGSDPDGEDDDPDGEPEDEPEEDPNGDPDGDPDGTAGDPDDGDDGDGGGCAVSEPASGMAPFFIGFLLLFARRRRV